MEVYDYQRVTPRLRDSQTRSYPVWWSSKFPSTSHQFWSYGLDGLVAKSKPSPLYIRRSSIQHMKQHIFPKSWLIKPWFSAGSVEFPKPICAFGILEKFTTVWGAISVVHCGKTNAIVPETSRNHGKNRGFWKLPSPRWHYFKDGLPWFMSQDHHHGLKIWHFQMSQPSQPVPLVLKHRNAPGHHRSPMSCRCRGSMRSIISTGHFSKASTEDFSVGNLQRLGILRIS